MQIQYFKSALAVMPVAEEDARAEEGVFSGYASVFGVTDNHGDIIAPGSFARTLEERGGAAIKLLWQHRADEPIGFFTAIREDRRGLFVEGRLLLDVQRGREAWELLKSGAIEGLSIGYTVTGSDIDPRTGVRTITGVDLWEISLVTFPANEEAGVTAVKQKAPATIREFEIFLREAGFSRKNAKAIALGGFALQGGDGGPRDADDEFAACDAALARAVKALS